MLGKKDLQIKYCELIKEKVKYAEDNIWRIMMFDGIIGGYFPQNAIYYEYGSGISTSGNQEWGKKIQEDWKATDLIMANENNPDRFQKAMLKNITKNKKKINRFLIKGNFVFKLKLKLFPRKTDINIYRK